MLNEVWHGVKHEVWPDVGYVVWPYVEEVWLNVGYVVWPDVEVFWPDIKHVRGVIQINPECIYYSAAGALTRDHMKKRKHHMPIFYLFCYDGLGIECIGNCS
jgi:hypothetical protein